MILLGDKMKKNNNLIFIIGVVILTLSVVVITSIIDSNKNKVHYETQIVTNYIDFYTVNSCLYRVITYIENKDTDALMLILNDNYKKDKKVNSSNIYSFLPNVENNSTFVSKKMYYKKINSNIKKFYVYGQIAKEEMDVGLINPVDTYFIIYLDSNKKVFAIEPYDGKIFSGGEESE